MGRSNTLYTVAASHKRWGYIPCLGVELEFENSCNAAMATVQSSQVLNTHVELSVCRVLINLMTTTGWLWKLSLFLPMEIMYFLSLFPPFLHSKAAIFANLSYAHTENCICTVVSTFDLIIGLELKYKKKNYCVIRHDHYCGKKLSDWLIVALRYSHKYQNLG